MITYRHTSVSIYIYLYILVLYQHSLNRIGTGVCTYA